MAYDEDEYNKWSDVIAFLKNDIANNSNVKEISNLKPQSSYYDL